MNLIEVKRESIISRIGLIEDLELINKIEKFINVKLEKDNFREKEERQQYLETLISNSSEDFKDFTHEINIDDIIAEMRGTNE